MVTNHFVIDTNVLVSAFVFKSTKPTQVLKQCLFKGIVVISSDLLEEYKSILMDEKFDTIVSKDTRQDELNLLIDNCEVIVPKEKIEICRDADDNKLLELAVATKAACIITGDKDLLALNPFRGVSIITPSDFLNKF